MATNYDSYEGDRLPESEFDPFEKLKPMNSFEPAKSEFNRNNDSFDQPPLRPYHHNQQQQQQQNKRHPFSRDFIDSMFTVVDKDLLFCKLFYFFFFGAFGSLFPLLAIYFKQLGMSAAQSGVLIGFRPFIEFLSAPFWGGLADKWRRGKEMLLFALLCWIVFTLAIAFVKPPAHKCLAFNGTHNILEETLSNRRRRDVTSGFTIGTGTSAGLPLSISSIDTMREIDDRIHGKNHLFYGDVGFDIDDIRYLHHSNDFLHNLPHQLDHDFASSQSHHSKPLHEKGNLNLQSFHSFKTIKQPDSYSADSRAIHSSREEITNAQNHYRFLGNVLGFPEKHYVITNAQNPLHFPHSHRVHHDGRPRHRRSPYIPDVSKIVNVNSSDIRGLVFNMHSTVVYKQSEVDHAFFQLLLLVVIGEFFSAPAITFADSVTLSFLGDDTQNYGRQRMFGSLGWGLAMFFVGMALDQSTTFPDGPCRQAHAREKNYTVCFAVFSVLMSCAFLSALQFRFDHHTRDLKIAEIPQKVKEKVKRVITGNKKIGRERLVEEDDDDDDFDPKRQEGLEEGGGGYDRMDTGQSGTAQGLKINPSAGRDMVTDALKAPGAKAGRGFGAVSGAIPFGSAEASYSDQPFFGKWLAVMKLLMTYQYMSVLFISWFMGFGIGIIFTFLFWHLQDLGGSPTLFGVASVINHISELLAYYLTGSLIVRYGHVKVLYAGLIGNICRFMYISLLRHPWWVLPFEFVQGLTHAAVWAACCAYITHAIPVELRSSAQGILQGLHHGLGRGCGAVFGGVLVNQYGSVVTFRIYGVTCILVLALYMGLNIFFEKRGIFSHGGQMPQDAFSDNAHLAPHGVPSGIARDLSNSRLAGDRPQEYGATSYEGASTLPVRGSKPSSGYSSGSSGRQDNPMHAGYDAGESITMFEPPRLPTNIYKQQPSNEYDKDYGP
ncbi:major facilitator superfamily domain-containing protein 6 [Plakobranchus ocellatus]|uniref:Major facilitator superfamily domain-containing protein 6 n=1 Tax=Plakobranchus ocellatus TaxID=259542 RepID=A0AAV4DEC3_9GAST|nr:major facilitator superfamily domain-containing protein 6 [Plakobranchus ocellatus]